MKPKKTIGVLIDYVKANRKGSRDAELEHSTGWTATHKVHKSDKTYSRKKAKNL
jgi:hypothetical protein